MPSKTPPLSVRLPPTLLDGIDALALERATTRHGALVMAVARGLTELRQSAFSGVAEAAKAGDAKAAAKLTETAAKFLSAAKEEAEAIQAAPLHVSVPLAGTFERKPMQKGTKK